MAEVRLIDLVKKRASTTDAGLQTLIMRLVDDGMAEFAVNDNKVTIMLIDKAVVLFRDEEFLGVLTYLNGTSAGYLQPPFDTTVDGTTDQAMRIAEAAFPYASAILGDARKEGLPTVVDNPSALYNDTATSNRMWMLLDHAFPQLSGWMPERYQEPDEDEIAARHIQNQQDQLSLLFDVDPEEVARPETTSNSPTVEYVQDDDGRG